MFLVYSSVSSSAYYISNAFRHLISLRKCLSVLSSWTKIHPILPGVVNFYVYTVLPSRSTIHPLPGVVHFQLLFQLPSISMRGWDQWEMGASKSPPSFGTLKVGAHNANRQYEIVGKSHFPDWIELEVEEVSCDQRSNNYLLLSRSLAKMTIQWTPTQAMFHCSLFQVFWTFLIFKVRLFHAFMFQLCL